MTRFPYLLLSLITLAIFCATTTYWAITLFTPQPIIPYENAFTIRPVSIEAAAQLFGSGRNSSPTSIQLFGILSFDTHHAAAIISNNGPARVINIHQAIDSHNTLSSIQSHSIVVENKGNQTEITLSKPNTANIIYVR